MKKIIPIGSDHAGFELKEIVINWLREHDFTPVDKGCFSTETGVAELGIVICGSGNGINMSVNKHAGIRGALCWEPEIAALARQHNNANIVSIPARFISSEKAIEIISIFIQTEFEGGRHQKRVEKITLN